MFRLTRYFSVASLLVFIVVTIILAIFYRQTAIDDVVLLGERNNVALTQAFANSLWVEFAPFINSASELSPDEIREHPETKRLREAVMSQTVGLSIVKIKIYDLEALTVFSTEVAQIGDDKSDNAGYLSARTGKVATELTHRDTFSAFEQTIEDRDVISSYVPIFGETGSVVGVFEVYDDVTPVLERIRDSQRNIIIGVVLILSLLYMILFLIVRRADHIIKYQQAEKNHFTLALEQQKRELLKQFIGNLSHDLKTPLSVIKINLFLLQRISNLEKQRTKLEQINVQTQRLEQLIQNVLTVSRLDYIPEFESKPVDLNQLVSNVEEQLSPLVKRKNLSIVTNLDSDLRPLLADEDELTRALLNLVENAINYTTHGVISIRTYLQTDNIIIEVSDNGIGISETNLPHIFDRFYRADEARSSQVGGSGLGLAIVEKIIEIHSGSIEVESTLGSGSTFRIQLPFISESNS